MNFSIKDLLSKCDQSRSFLGAVCITKFSMDIFQIFQINSKKIQLACYLVKL